MLFPNRYFPPHRWLIVAGPYRIREVTTDVFLSSPPTMSTQSALFIAWGQLLTYDLSLTQDNSSEPFDAPCNDGERQRFEERHVTTSCLCCPREALTGAVGGGGERGVLCCVVS